MAIHGFGRWALAAAVALGACSGDDEGTSPFDGADGGDDDDGAVTIECDLPQYNLDSMDCGQLGTAFENTMKAADDCNSDQDCEVIHPECEHWNAVGCFYVTNYCVNRATVADDDGNQVPLVSRFNSEAANCADSSDQCGQGGAGGCGEEPQVACVEHKCEFVLTTSL